jgi:hypothetical protein
VCSREWKKEVRITSEDHMTCGEIRNKMLTNIFTLLGYEHV